MRRRRKSKERSFLPPPLPSLDQEKPRTRPVRSALARDWTRKWRVSGSGDGGDEVDGNAVDRWSRTRKMRMRSDLRLNVAHPKIGSEN